MATPRMTAAEKSYMKRNLLGRVKSLEQLVKECRADYGKAKMGTKKWVFANKALMYAELNLASVKKDVEAAIKKLDL
jgi:hypothetical protein